MKKLFFFGILSLLALSLATTQVAAQRKQWNRSEMKSRWDSASPEQKKEFRKQLKARYDSLPPEEKEKIKQRILAKADSLSPAEKKQLHRQFRKRKKDTE